MANTEELNVVIESLRERADQIGLYMMGAALQGSATEEETEQASSMRELIAEGSEVIVQASFRLGSVAWSDRILNPDEYDELKAFELVAPSEEDILISDFLERAKSGELFDLSVEGDDNDQEAS